MKKVLALIAVVALSGCASKQQREAEWIAEAKAFCTQMAIPEYHQSHQRCVMDRFYQLEAQHRRSRQIMGAAIQQAGQEYNNTMLRQQEIWSR